MDAKKRILIVDDEPVLARVVGEVFTSTGRYEVRVVTDATRAVDEALDFDPHVAVLDIVMPRKDGGEILADLRRHPRFANLPAVFLTGIVSEAELGSRGETGGVPVVAKPVKPDVLRQVVAELLGEGD